MKVGSIIKTSTGNSTVLYEDLSGDWIRIGNRIHCGLLMLVLEHESFTGHSKVIVSDGRIGWVYSTHLEVISETW